MTSTFTQHLWAALLGIAVLSSCSRPVAYFQRGPVESFATANPQPVATPVQAITTLNQLPVKATTIAQPEAYASTDSRLITKKNVTKRMVRLTNLLTSVAGTMSPKATTAPRKMNLMERLVLKKMNKQISKQLAPNHPEKAMLNTGKLIGGAVLLIAGLIMLFAGTGTVAFIGIILSLVGALGILVGVLGI
ncbi:hypothetical protein [Spirosoma endophyticum]|uniref:Uncharacterized protein n=1 Tax=Spirosoma endophyticum TaxID=662367 RepID=A0A1I1EXQ3_9BACT|nr:hypothetical protein [Spirosoma endophyticum]SFB91811.1 hypothetical protein SAMN05216167_10191 [Spirosoma endophyticum]